MFSAPEFLFLILILLVMCLPFFPGWLELLKPNDDKPLSINLNSSSDPRHQALQLASEMKLMAASHSYAPGVYPSLEILNDHPVIEKNTDHSVFAPNKLCFAKEAKLKGTAFANGEIVIEKGCQIDAIVGESRIYIKEKASIKRFVDAKVLHIDKECRLGELASADEAIHIGAKCQFKRLYAPKIIFVHDSEDSIPEDLPVLSPIDIGRFGWYVNANKFIIPAESQIRHNVYTEQDLRVRPKVTIEGSIQSRGKVYLGEGTVIKGNIFAKDAIAIGRNCTILGNIFSQNSVAIDTGTVVGENGKIKSVIAKKEIRIHTGATIYGYVLTQGMGYVV